MRKSLTTASVIFTTLCVSIFIISCNKTSDEELQAQEMEKLEKYLEDNQITEVPLPSGLYYIETLAGSGTVPVKGDYVSVHYTGKLIDGEIFDSSVGKSPFKFPLGVGYVIKGWDEGIALMKKGGKATLIIPSSLGYGPAGTNSIPSYSTLVFDVELVEIEIK